MTLTKNDLRGRLCDVDEVVLLDALGVTSEMLVERFDDLIDEYYEKLTELVDWED